VLENSQKAITGKHWRRGNPLIQMRTEVANEEENIQKNIKLKNEIAQMPLKI
jgi:hypothetical protein